LKKIFYISLFIAGFHFSAIAQIKSSFISDDDAKVVKFYPNPAVSFINFEFQKDFNNNYTLYIYNFIGKKMLELKVNDEKMTVMLNGFYRGVYIFQLRDNSGNIVESGKFQVIN
jgi:hypothetical protein